MKRIIASAVILAAIISFSIWGTFRVNSVTEEMITLLEQAQVQNDARQRQALENTIKDIEEYFDDHERIFYLLLRRDLIYAPHQSIHMLSSYNTLEGEEDLSAEIQRTITHLKEVRGLFFSVI